jgi:hypothetical protein
MRVPPLPWHPPEGGRLLADRVTAATLVGKGPRIARDHPKWMMLAQVARDWIAD